jgi:hypothetical protein
LEVLPRHWIYTSLLSCLLVSSLASATTSDDIGATYVDSNQSLSAAEMKNIAHQPAQKRAKHPTAEKTNLPQDDDSPVLDNRYAGDTGL